MVRKSRTTVFIRYALSYLAVVLLLFFSITGYLYATMSGKAREEYIGMVVEKGGFPAAAKDALKLPDYHAAGLPKERDVTEVMRWLVEKNLVKQEYGYKELVKEDCLP